MSAIYHKAAKDGLLEVIRHVNKRDANKRDEDGMTPVHWAASCGNLECLRILCAKGGDPDKPCYDGSTSVHLAAACGQFHCLVFLTKFGSNIWSLDNQYHTPLEEAAARGQLDCVQYLDRVVAEQMLHHRARANKQKKEAEKIARKRMKKVERHQKKRDKEYAKRVKRQNGVVVSDSKENIPNERWMAGKKRTSSTNSSNPPNNTGFESIRRAQSLEHFSQITGKKTGKSAQNERAKSVQGSVRQTFLGSRIRSGSASSLNGGKSRSLTSLDSANIILHPKAIRAGNGNFVGRPKDQYIVRSSDGHGNSFTSVENMKFGSLSSYNSRTSTLPSSRLSWGSSRSMDSDLDTDIGEDEVLQTNDPKLAPLMTFLASLNLEQFTITMKRESIDMKALALCTDDDLKSAGIPLGPRRKILEAIDRRKRACAEPGPMMDTHL
ncbi:ankyrin repeat and SAM domain-containing protein 4B-like [Dendronephthya gigantea]|uniref:ankyrin repeat and SAM domain-containing protein 4B-like n=1 Tax=Dendronephthya gigantea TaxID=151771 RepID=UPI001069D6DF|nr:ankyrin repeat and SAM domain-containing protein 4B-like [Dendronephthya gigantea]